MHNILGLLIEFLSQYGYPALFVLLVLGLVGLPIPDEPLLTFCGYLIFRGRLNFELTFLTGFCGSACGITISYWLGARFGQTVIGRFGKYIHLTEERVLKMEALFRRFGPVLLTVGYFIPGVRHFTAVVAGMSGVRRGRFALFAYLGAAVWVGTFLTLGYVFGNSWQRSSELAQRYVLIGTAVLAAIAGGVWIFSTLRRAMLTK